MQNLRRTNSEVSGFKRYHPINPEFSNYDILTKKVKTEVLTKLSEVHKPVDNSIEDQIPPLVLPETNSLLNLSINNRVKSEGNYDYLKNLFLINQSFQGYFQLLTISQFAQQRQQKSSFLVAKRDDSASSCASYSTCSSLSPIQVPLLVPKSSEFSYPIETSKKFSGSFIGNINKKCTKVSACKNYIALLCTGFARSILMADSGSDILSYLSDIIEKDRAKYESLQNKSNKELKQIILDHIHNDICGKRIKKTNKGRDFKVRNTEELESLLTVKEEDCELTIFRKETLKRMLDYFFFSKYYSEWLEKGMINDANKSFFLKNKNEIQKKFRNPVLYKPHFDYNS